MSVSKQPLVVGLTVLLVAMAVFVKGHAPVGEERGSGSSGLSSAQPMTDTLEVRASSLPTPTLLPLPSQKTLSGGTQVFQTFNNCGPAALSMALSHLGIRRSQYELGQQLRPYQHPQGNNDDKSVTLKELAQKGSELGLVAYHRPAGSVEMLQRIIALDLPVITRTWLKEGEDIGHYRVVTGYNELNQQLLQDDSLQGADLWYGYDAFESLWEAFNYEFLVFAPPDQALAVSEALGELADEQRAWEIALARSQTAAQKNPTNAYVAFNQVVALVHLEKYAEAITLFEAIEPKLPDRMLWYQIEPLVAYYRLGQTDQLVRRADLILNNQNRAYSELYYLKGKVSEAGGDSTGAATHFAQASRYNSAPYWRTNVE